MIKAETQKKPFNQNARLTAWDIIKSEGLSKLPLNPKYFISKYGLRLLKYSQYAEENNCTVGEIKDLYDDDGFILFYNGVYTIFYNEEANSKRINWTLMHEVSHYLLGHVSVKNPLILRESKDKKQFDIDADSLTGRILCPSIVLHMCCVESPEEIAELCDISMAAAQIRWNHLIELRKRDKFLKLEEEKEILMQYAPFISSYLCKKFNEPKF